MLARLGVLFLAVALCALAYALGAANPHGRRTVYRFLPRSFDDVVTSESKAVEAYEQYA